jgi:hypothetical protein
MTLGVLRVGIRSKQVPCQRAARESAHHLAPQNVLLVLDFCALFWLSTLNAFQTVPHFRRTALLRRPRQTVRPLGRRWRSFSFLLRGTATEVKDL